jgi:hypothetical protein
MRLEPLYRVRFTYPESWSVGLDGGWQQMFFLAEGRCEGWVTGRFRGANFPRKEGAAGPFRPDFRAVIEADDGAVIMVEWHGYGRAYPPERRQVVGSVLHRADREPYSRLNDAVCVCTGEVRAPGDPAQAGPDLVRQHRADAGLGWLTVAGKDAAALEVMGLGNSSPTCGCPRPTPRHPADSSASASWPAWTSSTVRAA